ncbi:hypothetical protein HHI36_008343, partial [Cryptolaemus montrouzieri]
MTQKVKALRIRVRRYNERDKRKKHNRLSHRNPKEFYREQEANEETKEQAPGLAVIHECGSRIWSAEDCE